MFFCEFCEIFRNTFFYRAPLAAASEWISSTIFFFKLRTLICSLIISFSFLTFIVVKRDEKILEGKIKFRKRYFGSPIMQLGKCGFCMMALKGHCSLPCLLVKCSQNLIYFLEVLNSFSKFLDNSRKSQTVLGVLNSSLKF